MFVLYNRQGGVCLDFFNHSDHWHLMLYTNGKVYCSLKTEEANTSCIICALVEMDYSYSHTKQFITW